VEEINIDYQFRLKTRQRSFILYAPSSTARKDWMQDINASINGTHDEEIRLKLGNKPGITPSQTPEKKAVDKKSPRSTVTETPSPAVKGGDPITALPEEYYQGNVVKDLIKKGGKSTKRKGESESSSDSSSDEEESHSNSSESPKRSPKNSKSHRKSAKYPAGDLLGLGSETTTLNLGSEANLSPRSAGGGLNFQSPTNNLASPRTAGGGLNFQSPTNNLASPRTAGGGLNFQAQAPVNPFLSNTTTNPFLVNSPSSPPIMPRAPVSGVISPSGTIANPFQPNSGMNIVNPFL